MSEIINNSRKRVDELKSLISNLHKGVSPEETRKQLVELMGKVPYGEVVQAEEELIRGGMSREDVIKHCDLHTEAMKGNIDTSAQKNIPEGHPVHTFKMENIELNKLAGKYSGIIAELEQRQGEDDATAELKEIHHIFNLFMDVDKHYLKKENLLFPFLEKNEITGPPMVMWAKDDEVRTFLKSSLETLNSMETATAGDLVDLHNAFFKTAVKSVEEMVYKEENILFPMSLDTLTELDWYEIYRQTDEIGYCLYDPQTEWKPDVAAPEERPAESGKIKLPTGSFSIEELTGLFGALPVDLTFVDKDDNVRYFSHGERIFHRSRAILGRKVQHCHPPSSVHIVDKILEDFKAGRQDKATFWIDFKGAFVHIAYYAVKGENGAYLGTLEVTQNIAPMRALEGERRILQYDENGKN